jgi:type I restriction-modification system DNA methylase subunit
MSDLRTFTLWSRGLLTQEAGDLLQQVYRLDVQTGARLPIPEGHLLESSPESQTIQKRVEKLLEDEVDAGLKREEAVAKLIKETAFTHLNRLVAFKLMEARGLIRSPVARRHEANGFKMWLAAQSEEEALYNRGDSPNDRDGFGEAPRDRAYRHFLLWQCGELAREIQVLFDPHNVPSLLFPRPGVLKELIDALNADERKDDWAAGNEETLGWVYQYFNAEEKAAAFDKVFKGKKKFQKDDLPAATQIFTPRWVVRFLVENSLGRLWLSMHPDSNLGERWAYLTPLPASPPASALKPAREIRVLDPATGTMHFGLVAFDLLAQMYQEELANAGKTGWQAQPSVGAESEIPAAILANNLFGVDIDLRAVQLAVLALYLKAKGLNKQATLTESNLACADVAIFRGQHLTKISSEMELPGGVTRELFVKFRDSLEEACMMGSLVRLDRHFRNFESDQLRQSIDAYVEKKRAEGIDESYFANETGKGIRLLNVLERRYDIVCTNPPYLSIRNMNPAMVDFLKRHYKKSKGDLYSAFIERCAELMAPEGRLAMITQQSFMFISTFESLREILLGATAIETMAHVGPRAFAEVSGEKVNTTVFVLRREQLEMERREARGVYFRLVKEPDAESKRTAFESALARCLAGQPDPHVYEYRQGDFVDIPGSPWVYWCTTGLRQLFRRSQTLESVAEPRQGLATADNFRFIRYWWEVGRRAIQFGCTSRDECKVSESTWYPHVKGGGFRRWHGNQELVINYGQDGRELKAWADPLYGNSGWSRIIKSTEFYFREGVTWSALATKGISARYMAPGFVIGHKGPAVFGDGNSLHFLLGVLNSNAAVALLSITSPTIMFEVGQLRTLPVPPRTGDSLIGQVMRAIEIAKLDSREDETSYDFVAPPPWPDGTAQVATRHRDIAALERDIDDELYRLYDFSSEDRRAIEEELAVDASLGDEADQDEEAEDGEEAAEPEGASISIEELAQCWVGYAVGIALGRFSRSGLEHLIDGDGIMVVQRDHPDDLAQHVIDILLAIHNDVDAEHIVRSAASAHRAGANGDLRNALAGYLLGPFFKAHVRRYRKRPVYWLLQSPKQSFSVYVFHERATDQTLALLQGNRYLGGRMFHAQESLKQAKQSELTTEGREKAQWKAKAQDAAEELSDLEAFYKATDETNNQPIINAAGHPAAVRWVPEFDDGVLLNAAPLYRLTPAWKKSDPKLDLGKVWKALKEGNYPWAKTAMRYWPRETLTACKDNKSYRIAHGVE